MLRSAQLGLFLLVQASDAPLEALAADLGRKGAEVLLVSDGNAAMEAIRQLNGQISCLVVDAAVSRPMSGVAIPFWYRFYRPFGPVIYLADDPAQACAAVQYSAVVSRLCSAEILLRLVASIEEDVRSAHAADARVLGWSAPV